MSKFNIPDLKYSDNNPKKAVSLRLPSSLLKEIEKIAKRKGWDKTALVEVALDQFCQWENKKPR